MINSTALLRFILLECLLMYALYVMYAVGDFLWVVHCDHGSVWHRCGDMAPQMLDTKTWTRKERWKKGKRTRKGEGKGKEKKWKGEEKE